MRLPVRVAAALTLCCLIVWTQAVEAYLDPGSTSLFLQWLIGGVAAALVLLANYRTRVTASLRHWFGAAVRRVRGR